MTIKRLPRPGDRVRMVKSQHTTNWTRIDIGRSAIVIGHHAHAFEREAGPRLLIQLKFETCERWDSCPGTPVYAHPDQLEHCGAPA